MENTNFDATDYVGFINGAINSHVQKGEPSSDSMKERALKSFECYLPQWKIALKKMNLELSRAESKIKEILANAVGGSPEDIEIAELELEQARLEYNCAKRCLIEKFDEQGAAALADKNGCDFIKFFASAHSLREIESIEEMPDLPQIAVERNAYDHAVRRLEILKHPERNNYNYNQLREEVKQIKTDIETTEKLIKVAEAYIASNSTKPGPSDSVSVKNKK